MTIHDRRLAGLAGQPFFIAALRMLLIGFADMRDIHAFYLSLTDEQRIEFGQKHRLEFSQHTLKNFCYLCRPHQ